MSALFPALLGALLYVSNNLDVLHGLIAAPPGYTGLGIQRNADIAIYITWLRGYGKGWFLPNYNAPWATSPDFIAPGLIPVSLLQKAFSLHPILALQIFSFVAYMFVAYAVAFAYKTFCKTRQQALWSLLVALACIPLDALPGLSYLLRAFAQYGDSSGRVEFMTLSDGFFRGLVTWPFITYGTGFQILSMSLLARYVQTSERRWFRWLALFAVVSTLMHPFEIFLTTTVVAIVLLRKFGPTAETLKNIGAICVAMAIRNHALRASIATQRLGARGGQRQSDQHYAGVVDERDRTAGDRDRHSASIWFSDEPFGRDNLAKDLVRMQPVAVLCAGHTVFAARA